MYSRRSERGRRLTGRAAGPPEGTNSSSESGGLTLATWYAGLALLHKARPRLELVQLYTSWGKGEAQRSPDAQLHGYCLPGHEKGEVLQRLGWARRSNSLVLSTPAKAAEHDNYKNWRARISIAARSATPFSIQPSGVKAPHRCLVRMTPFAFHCSSWFGWLC